MEVYQSRKTAAEMEFALGAIPSIGANNHWFIGDVDTGVSAEGLTPYVGENDHWFVGSADTGIVAKGLNPYVGTNGNWWVGETDSGVFAGGVKIEGAAEVGQTIVVKAVDENGKPTEWEAADIEKKTKLITVLDVTLEQDTILSHDDTNDLSFGDAVIAGGHYFYKTPEGNQLKAKRIYGYIQPPSELKLPANFGISVYYADGTPRGWDFGDFLGNFSGIIGFCDSNTIAANNYFTFGVSHDLKIAYSGAGGSLQWQIASNRKMAYKTMDAIFPHLSGVKIAVSYGSFTIPAGTKIVIKAEVEDDA